MNGRSLPLLPLGILFLLVLLTFWLSRFVQPGGARSDAKKRHDPDAIVERFSARKLGPDGDIQYTLRAAKMTHYPDDDSSFLDDIVFTALQPDKPPVVARAPRGRLLDGHEEVVMEGGVVVESGANAKVPALKLNTPKMTIRPKENVARSSDGVVVSSENGEMKAAQFQLNTDTRRLNLTKATVTFLNPRAK